jgi:hypothetical protein
MASYTSVKVGPPRPRCSRIAFRIAALLLPWLLSQRRMSRSRSLCTIKVTVCFAISAPYRGMNPVGTNSVATPAQPLSQLPIALSVGKDRLLHNVCVAKMGLQIGSQEQSAATGDEESIETSTAVP